MKQKIIIIVLCIAVVCMGLCINNYEKKCHHVAMVNYETVAEVLDDMNDDEESVFRLGKLGLNIMYENEMLLHGNKYYSEGLDRFFKQCLSVYDISSAESDCIRGYLPMLEDAMDGTDWEDKSAAKACIEKVSALMSEWESEYEKLK